MAALPRKSSGVRLWHDDVRPAPEGWVWAKTNAEAQAVLESENVIECSLDHDLGAVPTGETDPREVLYLRGDSQDGCGKDLVRWMVEHDKVPPLVTIHSWNPAGAHEMAMILADAGHSSAIQPFEMPDPYRHIWEQSA